MSEESKRAFIITPIGSNGSDINREARGLIDAIIKPVLKDNNYIVDNPMEDSSSGSISKRIIKRIVDDELVVVNLTDTNPNVMYELAIRHSTNKPVIIFIRENQIDRIPFDIKDERAIPYTNEFFGISDLQDNFNEHIKSAISGSSESPIYNATGQVTIQTGAEESIDFSSAFEEINEKIGLMTKDIKSIKNSNQLTVYDTGDITNISKSLSDYKNSISRSSLRSAAAMYTGDIDSTIDLKDYDNEK